MSLAQFTLDDVAQHNSNKTAWMVIGNKVYDVTKFLDEHPGGCEVLLEQSGSDGTEAFEDVGHSTDARQMREDYLIGEIVEEERRTYSYDKKSWKNTSESDNKQRSAQPSMDGMIYYALIAVIVAFTYYLLA